MGIMKLADLIRSDAPDAVCHKQIQDYSGKVIALDASIVLNQFRAVTPKLSPLKGLVYRILTFLENGIKPVFVFDGKPPKEKSAVLKKRAKSKGFSNSTGTASSKTKDCIKLLSLLGVPVIQAPGDAEALCARLVREGSVDAVASEDMDTLPFGGTVLIRQLNAKKDSDITEYTLSKLLSKLDMTREQFVDLCILLGCDYCQKIKGLGPKKALKLIQKHHTIEGVVSHIKRQTYPVPQLWNYREARKIFLDAPQIEAPQLSWSEPDEEALVEFLCPRPFAEDKLRNRMKTYRARREKQEREKAAGYTRQSKITDFTRVTRKRQKAMKTTESPGIEKKRAKSK
ncbi:probable flap endonuclease 1 homolog [Betta splendens]|uniref:Probable flap endonuclease 1 homolog n=1 Tax=Betta splendens TaxID=158456 RepID=A0A6P7L086_BETSP|nr:probable flap endonuclease 1 homolog [Betta splendens]